MGFLHLLHDMRRTVIQSPLTRDGQGVWRMDYADMERRIRAHGIKVVIFCSPHNPCGRVWTREEIEAAMDVYARCGCTVISDEIWSDLILTHSPVPHLPLQSVSEYGRERTVGLYAPSKTFNLAGLIGSYHIVRDPLLRDRLLAASEVSHYNGMNVLSMHALIGAYSPEGRQWLGELKQVLSGNLRMAYDYFRTEFPDVETAMPEGTYMLYLDCADWCRSHGMNIRELQERGVRKGVIWQDGEAFCRSNTIRMNLALPHSRVQEAMDRLKKYVFIEG